MNADKDLFDDIEETEQASAGNDSDPNTDKADNILELTDVVLEGETASRPSEDSIFLNPEELDDILIKTTKDGIPVAKTAESAPEEEMEELPETDSEGAFPAPESSDFQFENRPSPEEDQSEPFPEVPHEDLDDVLAALEEKKTAAGEPGEDFLSGLKEADEIERPDDILVRMGSLDETDKSPEESVDSHGIPEEKLKEMLTGVIRTTVEKAIRETVSEVAEKVIREAIEGLKQSIESSGE